MTASGIRRFFPPYLTNESAQLDSILREALDNKQLIKDLKLEKLIDSASSFEDEISIFINFFYNYNKEGLLDFKNTEDKDVAIKELLRQKTYLIKLKEVIDNHLNNLSDFEKFLKDNYPEKLI